MTCDYCSIDRVAHYHVLTWLDHRVHLCDRCACEHGRARPVSDSEITDSRLAILAELKHRDVA